MRRAATWACLLAGGLILLTCAYMLLELARLMAPLGGLRIDGDFLRLNLRLLAAFALGLFLVVAGLVLLVRDRQDDG